MVGIYCLLRFKMTETALHRITVDFVSCDRQTLPDLLGRALHAQVMQWLQVGNPELARQVHDANLTPFSLSPLRTRNRHGCERAIGFI